MKKLLIFVLLLNSLLFSQSDNAYQIDIKNVKQINTKVYEFDITIKSPNKINITAYQCAFTFNQNITDGSLSLEYMSSQMNSKPIKAEIINIDSKLFLAFASGPGFEQIQSETLIAKYRLQTTTEFKKGEKLNLLWNFTGDITTIIMGTNAKDITNNFIYKPKK